MGLIKSANSPTNLTPFSMKDIEDAARRILLRAQQQAEQLLAAAQQEAEELKRLAREQGAVDGKVEGLSRGLEEGRKAGQQQALNEHREKLTALVGTLTEVAGEIDASRLEIETKALREVVDLACAIARRVTKRQARIDPEVLAANVQEAMKLVVHAADVTLAVHPEQRKTLEEVLPKLKMQWPKLQHVALIEDGSLSPGGCRVLSGHGRVDADVDGQLDRVIADLMPEVKSGDGQAV